MADQTNVTQNTNGQGNDGGQKPTITQEQFDALTKSVNDLTTKNEELNKSIAERDNLLASPEFLASMTDTGERTHTTTETSPEIDWNNLSMKDAASKIVNTVSELVDKKLNEITGGMSQMKHSQQLAAAHDDIKSCKAKHEDFENYKADMIKLAQKNPYLNAEQAYRLAKMDALDKQRDKEEKENQSQRKLHANTPNEPKELSGRAAAEAAYAELEEKRARIAEQKAKG